MTVETLCGWHALLMSGSPAQADDVGAVRRDQGWIGGSSPLDAHLVTPPPEHLARLLEDLVGFANRDDVDPIVQAASAHAQFETVHPFGDGNGRIGRALISWVLVRRLELPVVLPVSTHIAVDVPAHTAGLTQFRFGLTDQWVRWFAGTVSAASRRSGLPPGSQLKR